MMKTLVCGGRDNDDALLIYKTLDDHLFACKDHNDELLLINGGCKTGADKIARDWAMHREVIHITHPAKWTEHGCSGGPKRNREMLKVWKPKLVIAFRGGRGTKDMIKAAEEARIPVMQVLR